METKKALGESEKLCSPMQVCNSPNFLPSVVGRSHREQEMVPLPKWNRRPTCAARKHKESNQTDQYFSLRMWGLYWLQNWGLGALKQSPVPLRECGTCKRRCTLWFPVGVCVHSQLHRCTSMRTLPPDHRLFPIHLPLVRAPGNPHLVYFHTDLTRSNMTFTTCKLYSLMEKLQYILTF